MARKFDWVKVGMSAYTDYGNARYKEAETTLRKWFSHIERFGPKDERLLYTYGLIGRCLYMQEKFVQAQPYLRAAAHRYKGDKFREALSNWWWLAACYERRNQFLKAAQVYLQIVELTSTGEFSKGAWPCDSLTSAAGCYWRAGKYKDAEQIIQLAMEKAVKKEMPLESLSKLVCKLFEMMGSDAQNSKKFGLDRMARSACKILQRKMSQLKNPATKTTPQTDDYFGRKISDPYRWLEEIESADAKTWIQMQAQRSNSYLNQIPGRAAALSRLKKMFESEPPRVFYKIGSYYFCDDRMYTKVWRTDSIGKAPTLVLDSTAFPKNDVLSRTSISSNGELLTYWVATNGSDWETIYTKNLKTGKVARGALKDLRSSGISWHPDNSGFYYCAFFKTENVQKIMFHKIGTAQTRDTVIFKFKEPDVYATICTILNGQYLLVNTARGESERYSLFLLQLSSRKPRVFTMVREQESHYNYIGHEKNRLFFLTNKNAAMRRVVSTKIDNALFKTRPVNGKTPSTARLHWREDIAERSDYLKRSFVWGQELFCLYSTPKGEVIECLRVKDRTQLGVVPIPANTSVVNLRYHDYPQVALVVQGYTVPNSVFYMNLKRPRLELHSQMQTVVDTTQLVVEKCFARSTDGKQVPFFIRYKKGLRLNGRNPTILTGYGGFNHAVDPAFNFYDLLWIEQGGVCVEAILRGDGSLGGEWRNEGMRENKYKSFDDFAAVARALVRKGITSPAQLGIKGFSNGGLLIGAMLTKRSKLFGAAMIGSGLLDMLRYHEFGAERHFASEYGCADNKRDFEILSSYSPLHHVRKGEYPPVLIMTGSHDDRVRPAHSYKFTATLQERQTAEAAPILLRIEMNAGHSGLKSSTRVLDEWLFFGNALGLIPKCLFKRGSTLTERTAKPVAQRKTISKVTKSRKTPSGLAGRG